MICSRCGRDNAEDSNFCANCGERLAPPGTPPGDSTSIIPAVVDEATHTTELSADDQVAVSSLPKGHALLIVARGPNIGARYLLDTDVTTVGRHPDSDVFLDDITVSRHHVKLLRQGDQIVVEDQNSLNGTYVNRTLVDGSALLRNGDEVQIGKFRMIYFVSEHGLR